MILLRYIPSVAGQVFYSKTLLELLGVQCLPFGFAQGAGRDDITPRPINLINLFKLFVSSANSLRSLR